MIVRDYLTAWSKSNAPWTQSYMVEQDMIITRALLQMYNNPVINKSLVFRGGTALNKVYFDSPARYSEDIDLVQIKPEPIGDIINAIRQEIDSFLGKPKRIFTNRSVKLIYRYKTEEEGDPAKLKLEINTTEHFHIESLKTVSFKMQSDWWSGESNSLLTYSLDELMATKLKAMYQRKKGRDLYDLWYVLKNNLINTDKVVSVFKHYANQEGVKITKSLFEKNLQEKKENRAYLADVKPLLQNGKDWDENEAFNLLEEKLVAKI